MVRGNGTHAIGGEGVPEGLGNPYERPRGRVDELAARARELPGALNQANENFVSFVREQPVVALGAALGIGYVLGRMLRRVV